MLEARKGIRVLVADDDCVIAKTLAQILRLNGYEAEEVNSGEDAIRAALVRAPDVFISDVVMGGISGIEAAARVLEINPACLVALISGQANTADLLAQHPVGQLALEILSKPVHPKVLLDRLATFALMHGHRNSDLSESCAPNY